MCAAVWCGDGGALRRKSGVPQKVSVGGGENLVFVPPLDCSALLLVKLLALGGWLRLPILTGGYERALG